MDTIEKEVKDILTDALKTMHKTTVESCLKTFDELENAGRFDIEQAKIVVQYISEQICNKIVTELN